MITKLVLFLCLFCPVPDKERAILEDALSRCSSLERIGEIMDIVERHHLEYRIPVHPPVHRFHRISSAYGWRSDPVTGQRRFHSGVDIAAELASTVHAAADGKVIYSGRKGGYGYCVMIRHAYGFVTLYGHLSACYVPEGEEVRSGKVIGFIGSSGKSTGNHLHYEVRKYGMERLQTLTRLLKKEHTGSAAKIAKEMGVHRNTIINYFLELRAMGAEIEYDNERNTYYFKKSFDIQLKIKI